MSGRSPIDREGHGTLAAIRRHYRRKTPLCDACRYRDHERSVAAYAKRLASGQVVHVVHADRGDGRPRCGTHNIDDPLIGKPGQPVTCQRCNNARGTS